MMSWLGAGCCVMAAAASVGAYAHWIEPNRIRLRELEIKDPAIMHPLTILHLSDFHLRDGLVWQHKMSNATALFRHVAADLVLFSGDFLERESGLPRLDALLSELHAPLGLYTVWGNHDVYHYTPYHLFAPREYRGIEWDRSLLEKTLATHHLEVLHNRHITLDHQGFSLVLIGISDFYSRQHDLDAAFHDLPQLGYRILLTHSPEIISVLPAKTVNLILAGHTHGGQIRVPGIGALASRSELPANLIHGTYRYNGSTVVVNHGLGEGMFVPFRFFCPPEAVVIKLLPSR